MGIIENGILGGVSGKVGGVVGGEWKGITYLRAHKTPANPQSTAQTAQRTKMAAIVAMARTLLATVIHTYWDPIAVKMSGYNKFVQDNLYLWTSPTTFALAIVSRGNLEKVNATNAEYETSTGMINIGWSSIIAGNGLSTDQIVCVIYDDANNYSYVANLDERATGESFMTIATGLDWHNLHCYIFATRGVGSELETSPSDYRAVTEA